MSIERKERKTETKCMSYSTTDSNNDISIQNYNSSNMNNVLNEDKSLDNNDNILNELYSLDNDNISELNSNKTYCVVTSDNIKFFLTKKEMILSNLLITAINDDSENENVDIPIHHVDSSTMSKIVIYMKYHSTIPIPENNIPDKVTSSFKENIKCTWDVEFIENIVMLNPETAKENLYSLIRASNYMDIQSLLQLACVKVASMLKGKSLDSIKDIVSPEKPYVKDV
jgi:S-phase kinase-associated protein 1